MDKEKILAAARCDKNRGQEYENDIFNRSGLLVSSTALILSGLLMLVEVFTKGSVNAGLLAVGTAAAGIDCLWEGLSLKKRPKIAYGIVLLLLAIAAIVAFIGQAVSA